MNWTDLLIGGLLVWFAVSVATGVLLLWAVYFWQQRALKAEEELEALRQLFGEYGGKRGR